MASFLARSSGSCNRSGGCPLSLYICMACGGDLGLMQKHQFGMWFKWWGLSCEQWVDDAWEWLLNFSNKLFSPITFLHCVCRFCCTIIIFVHGLLKLRTILKPPELSKYSSSTPTIVPRITQTNGMLRNSQGRDCYRIFGNIKTICSRLVILRPSFKEGCRHQIK